MPAYVALALATAWPSPPWHSGAPGGRRSDKPW